MYRMLVVDDEKLAVQAIAEGIDWSGVGVSVVYKAYNTKQAIEILNREPVDCMITDIEMPGRSGIELMEWAVNNHPGLESVFLTGYADFSYAQKAVHLGIHDYILKPIELDKLLSVVKEMIRKLEQRKENEAFRETYNKYVRLWEDQLPSMSERIWQDLLSERCRLEPEKLNAMFQLYEIPVQAGGTILPILISVERWKEEFSLRDEEIMEYALRKAAQEIILHDGSGTAVQSLDGHNVVLIHLDAYQQDDPYHLDEQIKGKCREYIQSCIRYFKCSLSCYIGEWTLVPDLAEVYRRLVKLERDSVSASNQVVSLREGSPQLLKGAFRQFPASQWSALLEAGEEELLMEEIRKTINHWGREQDLHPEMLESLYYTILHMVYTAAHKKTISISAIYPDEDLLSAPAARRSVHHFVGWCDKVIRTCVSYFKAYCKDDSVAVMKIKQWIQEHFHEEITRDTIAGIVHVNAGYVSRIFRRETGYSLSEYILNVRMEEAKCLLSQTNLKISAVAEAVGFSHFSYFAQQFKKCCGYSPLDYRKLTLMRDE
nr:response regulator [Paenibacillus sp. PL91]